eukprot:TRINITY_DN70236_c0_g1_i1.p2 TRINITY_DN70236_c0_g1~~TRINITY_DN70236_c0_g1_i1.p2  ORF type:complete len:451 (+),score=159.85 TRINITY_DN70236_c0_g1_i1:85-1353(+)
MQGAPRRWAVICCPVSGSKNGQKVVEEQLMPAMEREGLVADVLLTQYKAHATELAKQHGSRDCGLIAVGGDGTIHEIMDGLIEKGLLGEVPLGLLSQGTMNFYAVSGALPSASALPGFLRAGKFRPQGLMRVEYAASYGAAGSQGDRRTMCFEALYFGVGYKPAKGAQEWRNSCAGPMGGIMSNLIKANWDPANEAAITGTMRLTPADGGQVVELTKTFYWIVVTQRSPYNGTLSDSMWVSWITLPAFPGFKRMMDFFAPPMELFAGTATVFEGHMRVSKFEWTQTKPAQVGVCLDGDPVDAGSRVVVEHVPGAWRIAADTGYPARIDEKMTKVGMVTAPAAKWLQENDPAKQRVYMPPPATAPTCCCRCCCPCCTVRAYSPAGTPWCSGSMLGACCLGPLYTLLCWQPKVHWVAPGYVAAS